MASDEKVFKGGGIVDVEIDGHVMTIIGSGGTVAITVIDLRGPMLYVFHPMSGWYKSMDMTQEPPETPYAF